MITFSIFEDVSAKTQGFENGKIGKLDFTINLTKSYFWGGLHDVDPPKHMILSMVHYLQELKTIILEKSGISRDNFFHLKFLSFLNISISLFF